VARRAGWTVPALAEAYLAGGARFIQIRSKHTSSAVFLRMCEDVVRRARQAGAVVIVNDRADIAKLASADGVHVGQEDLDPASVRSILGSAAIVGLSTHSPDQVQAASLMAVDYIAVGPVFVTATKSTGYSDVGTGFVAEASEILKRADCRKPIVAIGGITLERAPDVIRAGAAAVAVISDLLSTGDPETRVRDYLRAIR
jgi:thiamine-phosphate pyrophosphorylase